VRSLQSANQEKADLEILLETVTEHATNLENQILESNHQQLYVDPQYAEIFRQTLATAGQINLDEFWS